MGRRNRNNGRHRHGKGNHNNQKPAAEQHVTQQDHNRSDNRPAGIGLPSPTVLQEYEYATEGAASRILEMAEIEQDRRNAWEDDYLQFYKKSLRMGQLFGFLLLIVIVFACMSLAANQQAETGLALSAIAFFSVTLANLFSSRAKRKHARGRR